MVRPIVVLGLACAFAAPAMAQAPPQNKPPVEPMIERNTPDRCATARATVGQGGDVDVSKPNDKTLSEKLARSNGVICPPQRVDPQMEQTAPPGGRMPVLPPPGTPGGNPQVQPK